MSEEIVNDSGFDFEVAGGRTAYIYVALDALVPLSNWRVFKVFIPDTVNYLFLYQLVQPSLIYALLQALF